MNIEPIKRNELYLSGFFGKKVYESLNQNNMRFQIRDYKGVYMFNGYVINLHSNNFLEYHGLYHERPLEEMKDKFDVYIENIIKKVEDDFTRQKIIEVANNDVSRSSRHHILNIELLVKCALTKGARLFYISKLITDKKFYEFAQDDYDFYLFAMYDAKNINEMFDIYESIREQYEEQYEENNGYFTKVENKDDEIKLKLINKLDEETYTHIFDNMERTDIN